VAPLVAARNHPEVQVAQDDQPSGTMGLDAPSYVRGDVVPGVAGGKERGIRLGTPARFDESGTSPTCDDVPPTVLFDDQADARRVLRRIEHAGVEALDQCP
jgi:hypothetical protein